MGTSKQVATDKTSEGHADNRRVVVRILQNNLQNKGIAGTQHAGGPAAQKKPHT
jgi:OOP family OmpA-OmpF porin